MSKTKTSVEECKECEKKNQIFMTRVWFKLCFQIQTHRNPKRKLNFKGNLYKLMEMIYNKFMNSSTKI